MSSLLNVLLNCYSRSDRMNHQVKLIQTNQPAQIKEQQQSSYKRRYKTIASLIYDLLITQKFDLIATIFTQLKKEEHGNKQKILSRDLNNSSEMNSRIEYCHLIEAINLQQFVQFLSRSYQQKDQVKQEQEQKVNNNNEVNFNNLSQHISLIKLSMLVQFFIDCILIQRTIKQSQLLLFQKMINFLSQYLVKNNVTVKSQQYKKLQQSQLKVIQRVLQKSKLLILLKKQTLHKQPQQSQGQQKRTQQNNQNKQEQRVQNKSPQLNYLYSQQQKLPISTEGDNLYSSSDRLIDLYKRFLQLEYQRQSIQTSFKLIVNQNSSNRQFLIKQKIIQIIDQKIKLIIREDFSNNQDKNKIQSNQSSGSLRQTLQHEVFQLLQYISKSHSTQVHLEQNKQLNQTNINYLILDAKLYYTRLKIIHQLIYYFFTLIPKSNDNSQRQNNITQLISQFIHKLLSIYSTQLNSIYQNCLVEGLQNDLKTNFYLSHNKMLSHLCNLYFFVKWININDGDQSITTCLLGNKKINQNQNQLNQINQNQNQLNQINILDIFKYKNINLNINLNSIHNQKFNHLVQQINNNFSEIANFLSKENKGIQNRLFSTIQIQTKIIPFINHIPIEQQLKFNIVNSIQKYFVFDQQNNNNVQTQVPLSKNTQTNQTETKNLFVKLSLQKLKSDIIFSSLQSTSSLSPSTTCTQTLIRQILQMKQSCPITQSQKSIQTQFSNQFLTRTFKFHSPTFNNQYLTFNYIYGQMKQVYFYQNHHYSHILLQLYQSLISNLKDNELVFSIFCHLRDLLGKYAKDKLILPNSQQFYQYLNLFKFCYVTFNKQFLSRIQINQLVLLFDLILNEIIIKQNHPLIRQYVQIIMARTYFTIKNISNNQSSQITENDHNNYTDKKQMFYDCRNRMINVLTFDQLDVHNLNIGVPVLILLGYELMSYLQTSNTSHLDKLNTLRHKQKDLNDQYGSKQIKPFHQTDIHYILVRYISCHVAYMRTICQYYLSKYLTLIKQSNRDPLLQNLYEFWYSDKDSIKIMANISIAIEGFKKEMERFHNQEIQCSFYLEFERVEERPDQTTKYFLIRDTIEIFNQILTFKFNQQNYSIKSLIRNKVLNLKKQAIQIQKNKINQLNISSIPVEQIPGNKNKNAKLIKKNQKNNKQRITKQGKQKKSQTEKNIKKLVTIQAQKPQQNINNMIIKLTVNLKRNYQKYQKTSHPKVIIIATLLQKCHNFGYLVRTLTNHDAMLVVPSKQPFLHPECIQLMPNQDQIDAKVIEIKPKHLQSFIRMYQQLGYPLIALEQCSKSIQLQKTIFPDRYMLLLGNQRIGAPASLLSMADILVEIPQVGKVRSLNVHVSMVICFWEYLKQLTPKFNFNS